MYRTLILALLLTLLSPSFVYAIEDTFMEQYFPIRNNHSKSHTSIGNSFQLRYGHTKTVIKIDRDELDLSPRTRNSLVLHHWWTSTVEQRYYRGNSMDILVEQVNIRPDHIAYVHNESDYEVITSDTYHYKYSPERKLEIPLDFIKYNEDQSAIYLVLSSLNGNQAAIYLRSVECHHYTPIGEPCTDDSERPFIKHQEEPIPEHVPSELNIPEYIFGNIEFKISLGEKQPEGLVEKFKIKNSNNEVQPSESDRELQLNLASGTHELQHDLYDQYGLIDSKTYQIDVKPFSEYKPELIIAEDTVIDYQNPINGLDLVNNDSSTIEIPYLLTCTGTENYRLRHKASDQYSASIKISCLQSNEVPINNSEPEVLGVFYTPPRISLDLLPQEELGNGIIASQEPEQSRRRLIDQSIRDETQTSLALKLVSITRSGNNFLAIISSNLSGESCSVSNGNKKFKCSINDKEIYVSIPKLTGYILDITVNSQDITYKYSLYLRNPYRFIEKLPLSSPLESIDRVTQWYGQTAYSENHTGIDLVSSKKLLKSPKDAIVHSLGWDNYYGECLSGGWYVTLSHPGGLYTTYMHLRDIIKPNGDRLQKGEHLWESQPFATIGNSGFYKCKPLSEHLHFEVRNGNGQINAVDPTKYVNWDWQRY